MKGMSGTFLALVFVIFSLISLVAVNPTWDSRLVQLAETETRVSELGLRINMRR